MDRVSPLIEAFGMLDIVLAVFGAVILGMWFGRGRTLRGLLTGALVGGLIKPLVLTLLLGGALIAAQESVSQRQTPEQQEKTIEFWTE